MFINQDHTIKVRCAIYTRKSSEEGLEQEFNSLDAQRLAAENFIASQIGKGWVLIPTYYDDGGCSGGNLERPALKRLFADIEQGKVDCVVVYKIDRLTRSLFDFQKVIDLFDKNKTSFVSVTQSFNTSDSMGRLMLNVLLSFAQYEREITGERIRDKVDASKKKGIWMGGTIPLGYDATGGTLSVNEIEAQIVQQLFELYVKTHSIVEVAKALNQQNFTTKIWVSKRGNLQKGKKFNKQNVKRILENQIYIGMIEHKKATYKGLHQPIISEEIWNKAQKIIINKKPNKVVMPVSRANPAPLLKGIIRCGICGSTMVPTYTKKGSKRYRYYLCLSKAIGNNDDCKVARISATEAENLVVSQVLNLLKKPEFIVHTISKSAGQIPEGVVINSFKQIENIWDELFVAEQSRIINLLVKDVTIHQNGLNIRIFKNGLSSLSNEIGG